MSVGQQTQATSNAVDYPTTNGQNFTEVPNGTGPAPIQAFGPLPQVNPTYAQAATVDPNSAQAYLNQYEQTTMQGLQPLFQQQDESLAQSNAARGITSSGSAAQLQTNLQGQQAGQYANAIAPMISQAFGYDQQDLTQNAANQQQVNLTNAGAGNQASYFNAGTLGQAENANATAYNNYQNELLGYGAGMQNELLTAYLNSYGPNTGVESAYNTGVGGIGSVYGNVYGNALGEQGAALGAAGEAAGAYFG